MLKCLNVKTSPGFTLIELLTVTAIVGILAAIILPSFPLARKQLSLQRSAYKLAQDIRKAKEMAISAKECSTAVCGGPEPRVPPGYGIYLVKDNSNYLIYADINSDQTYNSAVDAQIENIDLERGASIKSISSQNSVSINFEPPDPEVTMTGNVVPSIDQLEITLGFTASSNEIRVIVNKVGLIFIQ